MKRFAFLLIAGLAFVLNGCIIEIVDVPGNFTINNAIFSTNQSLDLGVNGIGGGPEAVICDNKTTELIYSFGYSGTLNRFRSYLRGEDTGSIPADGDVTFSTGNLGTLLKLELRFRQV
jgi:hypothetical protein